MLLLGLVLANGVEYLVYSYKSSTFCVEKPIDFFVGAWYT